MSGGTGGLPIDPTSAAAGAAGGAAAGSGGAAAAGTTVNVAAGGQANVTVIIQGTPDAANASTAPATAPPTPSSWIAIAMIIGGLAAFVMGVVWAFQAGGRAKEAGAIGDQILERWGQADQSAALRTCVRLAIKGQDCEGGNLDGEGVLPRRGGRAEKCGYSESKCMSSAELQAFGKCMRGDNL